MLLNLTCLHLAVMDIICEDFFFHLWSGVCFSWRPAETKKNSYIIAGYVNII